jgi:hypothetical protein
MDTGSDRDADVILVTGLGSRVKGQGSRCLREHAPRFRADFQARFPEGVTLTRETWVQRENWS